MLLVTQQTPITLWPEGNTYLCLGSGHAKPPKLPLIQQTAHWLYRAVPRWWYWQSDNWRSATVQPLHSKGIWHGCTQLACKLYVSLKDPQHTETGVSLWQCLFVGCLTSQQHASVSQGQICTGNFTCCHAEIKVADQTFYLTQSQYTDTEPTSPSADPISIMPGAWQGSHWSANF